MILLQISIPSVPLMIGINIVSIIVGFLTTFEIMKYRIRKLEARQREEAQELDKVKALQEDFKDTVFKVREKDQKTIEERFRDVDFKREQLKDILTEKIHEMANKITEIHTILTKSK